MALIDYSDLEKEISQAEEPKILPKGVEVKVRIVSVRYGTSESNGIQYFSPVFDVPDDPMVIEFNDFFWDLREKEALHPKQYSRNLYKFKTFTKAFGIDISKPFDFEDFIGHEGWIITGVKKEDEYGDRNTVAKYIVKR